MKACHITHFVVIHRRSQMLLTFNRHQMVYNISCVLPCAEVTGKGYFVIQQQSNKVKNKVKHQTSDHFQHCFRFILHFKVCNHNFYSVFMNLSTLSCYIDLEISPYCMVNPKAFILWKSRKGGVVRGFFYIQGAWYYSGNKIKYCDDTPLHTPFLSFVNVCKFRCRIGSTITVKTSSEGGNAAIFMPIYSADRHGFVAVL